MCCFQIAMHLVSFTQRSGVMTADSCNKSWGRGHRCTIWLCRYLQGSGCIQCMVCICGCSCAAAWVFAQLVVCCVGGVLFHRTGLSADIAGLVIVVRLCCRLYLAVSLKVIVQVSDESVRCISFQRSWVRMILLLQLVLRARPAACNSMKG